MRASLIVRALIPLLLLAAPVGAATLHVNADAPGPAHDGASWTTAFLSVQAALDAAHSGDEVWVARGVYTELITPPAGVALFGGFAATETARDQRDWRANPTVLDGSKGSADAQIVTCRAENVVVDGFTIRNARWGVMAQGGSATIAHVLFNPIGTAVEVIGSSVTITNCVFAGNGTAVFAISPESVNVANCTISGKAGSVDVSGAGKVVLTNNTITGNRGEVSFTSTRSVVMVNNIIAFNASRGVVVDRGETITAFRHNDVFGNGSGDFYGYTPPADQGNISLDPKLSNEYHDVHIQPDSPCRDAGDDSAVTAGETDVDGQPRIQGARVDIGSDESDGTRWVVPTYTWHVSITGDDTNDGLTWATSKRTVAGALAVAQGPGEVWVAAGTYVDLVVPPAGIALYGGFAGTETDRSQRDWKANPTVLDGSGEDRTVVACAYRNIVIDGFTVRNGTTGVSVYGSATVAHNTIVSNSRFGVYVQSLFTAILVSNNTIAGNGYGVWADQYGVMSLVNNTITGNGRGIDICAGAMALANNIIAFNNGPGLYVVSGGHGSVSTFSHNDVYGNGGGNFLGYTPPADQGNLSVDPKLSNIYHDIHIEPDSPCRDAGEDAAVIGTADIDAQPRIQGAHVDIGSDESDGTVWAITPVIWHVSPNGSDTNDGTTWATAKKTIAAALARAQGPDEVWVAKGTYAENVFPGPGVSLYGGFAGTETDRSQRNGKGNPTIMEGGNMVVYCKFPNVVLDGFVIRNSAYGVYVAAESATITNNTITGNGNAGIYMTSLGSATVYGNTITANKQAAVVVSSGTMDFANNAVTGNRGAGITVRGTANIRDCLISGNGSGVGMDAGTATIVNTTIAANGGSGISFLRPGTVSVANSIVAYNGARGIDRTPTATIPAFSHNDVYGNATGDFFGYTPPAGQGNISAEPRFVDRESGNYRLRLGSPCIGAGFDAAVSPGETDLDGNPRILGPHVDMGAYELLPAISVLLGASIQAPPAAVEGVVYAGGADGKLHAFASPTLAPVPGFPVDISSAVGAPVSLNSRPAVYYGRTGKAVYLTTNLGHVVKVWPDGRVAWISHPIAGLAMSTPAVTPDGNVYVDLGLGATPVLSFLFKLDEATGRPAYASPYLGASPGDALSDRSAAVDQRYVYVNASGTGMGSLAVLNQDNLTVRASFAAGQDALPPFLAGARLFLATRNGILYRVNSATMDVDTTFGSQGQVKIGEGITAGPFPDGSGNVYVGTVSGKLWKVDASTGAKSLFLDTGMRSAIVGLVVLRDGIAVFGTASGTLVQAPLANPDGSIVTQLGGPPAGGPVVDPVHRRVFVTTTGGTLWSIPGA